MEGQGARAGPQRGLSTRLRDWDFVLRELGKNRMMVGAQGQPCAGTPRLGREKKKKKEK